jgi:soluble lytic murein transglycosylase
MRGTGRTFSRLPAACALIAGLAALVGISSRPVLAENLAPNAAGPDGDTAFAQPRLGNRGTNASPVALPQPLSPSEAARFRRLFSLQASGDIAAATREAALVDQSTALLRGVMGHVTADRLLSRFTRATQSDLQSWLADWADLPDAQAVHALLTIRLPRGEKLPPVPAAEALLSQPAGPAIPVPEETEVADRRLERNRGVDKGIWDLARTSDGPSRIVARTASLPPGYAAQLRGEAAQILFTLNRDADALAIGRAGMGVCGRAPSCEEAALPGLAAGLAAWRMGQERVARDLFEASWHAGQTTAALRAASAFWAARAALRVRDPAGYYQWIGRAAAERRTFYGLIAGRILGLGVQFAGDRETLSEADLDAVMASPAGARALALLQIGQTARADAELRMLWPAIQASPSFGRAVMLVAQRAGLADLAGQLADFVQSQDGRPRDFTRFPIPRLRPEGGFTVDAALVYGLARTESNFDTGMVSSAGARGLMQIMPATARFVSPNQRIELHDPANNLAVGQRYVGYLAGIDIVAGDLLRLLATYNSGPGGFIKWSGNIRDSGDPLLFIEAVPVDETRSFIPRVLAYSWIYAARLHLPAASLDELAAGVWPRYHPVQAVSN